MVLHHIFWKFVGSTNTLVQIFNSLIERTAGHLPSITWLCAILNCAFLVLPLLCARLPHKHFPALAASEFNPHSIGSHHCLTSNSDVSDTAIPNELSKISTSMPQEKVPQILKEKSREGKG